MSHKDASKITFWARGLVFWNAYRESDFLNGSDVQGGDVAGLHGWDPGPSEKSRVPVFVV